MAELGNVLQAIVTICILVFSAKILGEVFSWRKIPSVLGEMVAGMILGPYAIGQFLVINGFQLIQINEIVGAFGEIGGILILFAAGLEMTFQDFRKVGKAGFVIGTLGVIVPFVMGYGLAMLLNYGTIAGLVVGASLVATSISITSLVLMEINKTRAPEARVMVSAAVVDDVLGLAILGVIVSFITSSTAITALGVVEVIAWSLALWLGITVLFAIVLPRIINFISKGKTDEPMEAAATAACFGASALAAALGLSAIVGAFAAGMAIASSRTIEKIREYIKKISTVFSPVFFALAGAQFNIQSFITTDWMFYLFFIILVVVAILSKMVGCGLPAAFFLKSRSKGFKVGYGMISRGEVGLIVAGVAIGAGAISQSLYAAILGMILITTIIAPLLLRKSYVDELPGEEEVAYETGGRDPPDFIPTYPLHFEE
ncbi:cation:proton antiporter [Candidatus Bathyarchaeota archaeon]|nr:cation:proton antiporter [Candidatus Bathyarchaeota archaeon]